MKADDVKAEMLNRDGKKMLKLALKKIKSISKNGYDHTTFLPCRSSMVAELVANELSKLGYEAKVGSDAKTKNH